MAKKRSKSTPKYLVYIPVILAVVVVAFMFLTAVKYTGKITEKVTAEYSGWQTIFGYSEKVAGESVAVLKFSILGLLALLLPVAGAILQLSKSKLLKLIGAVCALGGTVMLFLLPNLIILADATKVALVSSVASLGLGGIFAGIISAIETLVIGYTLIK